MQATFEQLAVAVKEKAKKNNIPIVENFLFPQSTIGGTGYADSLRVSEVPADVCIGILKDGRRAISLRGSYTCEWRGKRSTEHKCEVIFERYSSDTFCVTGGPFNMWRSLIYSEDIEEELDKFEFDFPGCVYCPSDTDVEETPYQRMHTERPAVIMTTAKGSEIVETV